MLVLLLEANVVRRHQRQTQFVGQIDQHALGGGLFRPAMPLKLDIEPIAKDTLQFFQRARTSSMIRPVAARRFRRPSCAAGQADQSLGMLKQGCE
jgi:hypothetical protein